MNESPLKDLKRLDLNLLRVFAAVHETRSVSRAAEALGISQPAASNAIARLRPLIGDALFARAHGGVRPTPAADRLALAVKEALSRIGEALEESAAFDPGTSERVFRLHLSDIGEARFLPALMTALDARAPRVRIECHALPHARIAAMLDSGELDFAIGFLPSVTATERMPLLKDRYGVMLRDGHPFVGRPSARRAALADLRTLDFVAVRSHSETLRILEELGLQDRVRLSASHFLALPAIVRSTDLGVVMPADIARGFASEGPYAVIEPRLPGRDFTVSLHASRLRRADPGQRWLGALVRELFAEEAPARGRPR
jgi:DNA-binding transcriptional LysR family regulator